MSQSLAGKKLEHRLLVSPSSGGRGRVFRNRLRDYWHLVKPAEVAPFLPGANRKRWQVIVSVFLGKLNPVIS